MELKNVKLTELNVQEMNSIDGGFVKELIRDYLIGKALDFVIDNFHHSGGVNAHTYKLGHVGGGRP